VIIINRQKALERKLKVFFTGKPCANGHISERYTKSYMCKACLRLSQKKYFQSEKGKTALNKYKKSEKGKATLARIYSSEKFKEQNRKALKKYLQSEKGKLQKKYFQSEKGKTALNKYKKSEKGKATLARIYSSEKFKEENRKRLKRYYKEDPKFRFFNGMRSRVKEFLRKKNSHKENKLFKYIGCSKQHFINHIEKQFRQGMSWDNWGKVWELDHIVPLASFKDLNEKNFNIAFNYRNHQPLLVKENSYKRAKFNKDDLIKLKKAIFD